MMTIIILILVFIFFDEILKILFGMLCLSAIWCVIFLPLLWLTGTSW